MFLDVTLQSTCIYLIAILACSVDHKDIISLSSFYSWHVANPDLQLAAASVDRATICWLDTFAIIHLIQCGPGSVQLGLGSTQIYATNRSSDGIGLTKKGHGPKHS